MTPTIPTAISSALIDGVEHADAAAVTEITLRDDPRLAPKAFLTAAMGELSTSIVTPTLPAGGSIATGNKVYTLYTRFTLGMLGDLRHAFQRRRGLGTACVVLAFAEDPDPARLVDELATLVNSSRATYGSLDAIFAGNVPMLKMASDPESSFEAPAMSAIDNTLSIITEHVDTALAIFQDARKLPTTAIWPVMLYPALCRLRSDLQAITPGTQGVAYRRDRAVDLIAELCELVREGRPLRHGIPDNGTAAIGLHPSYGEPVLGVLRPDGSLSSLHDPADFPNVRDGDTVTLSY